MNYPSLNEPTLAATVSLLLNRQSCVFMLQINVNLLNNLNVIFISSPRSQKKKNFLLTDESKQPTTPPTKRSRRNEYAQ